MADAEAADLPGAVPTTAAALRRLLLERQGLAGPAPARGGGPARALGWVRRLECVQIDPVATVARNQHLVIGARQPGYAPSDLEDLLGQGRIFEDWANAMSAIPIEDYPLFEPTRRRHAAALQPEVQRLGPVVDRVLQQMAQQGPLTSRGIVSDARVAGYWDNSGEARTKATSHALNVLLDSGRIAVVARRGGERLFDLAERAVPAALLRRAADIDPAEADAARMDKYLRAYRVFDLGDVRLGWARLTAAERRAAVLARVAAGAVVPLAVAGVRRPYFLLAEDLPRLSELTRRARRPRPPAEGPIRLLPPLDNLLWRRRRLADLFGFHYTWEVYTPAAKRRFGHYAMPILAGERLIGRVDPRLDREAGCLVVNLLQIEPGVRRSPRLGRALDDALAAFAVRLGARGYTVARTEPGGLLD